MHDPARLSRIHSARQQHSARTHTHSMPDDAPKKSFRRTKEARLLLKLGSLGTGIFLILAGVFGSMGAVTIGGGWQYFAGSVYAILFGIIMLIVEIKDKVLIISALYHIVESEIKFLTLQTGKGIFYLGIGILVFFIAPEEARPSHCSDDSEEAECNTSYVFHWGVINVAALCLAIVGFFHTFHLVLEPSSEDMGLAPQRFKDEGGGGGGDNPFAIQPLALPGPGEGGGGGGGAITSDDSSLGPLQFSVPPLQASAPMPAGGDANVADAEAGATGNPFAPQGNPFLTTNKV